MATRKSATKNGFLIFTDQLTLFENIPDESIGKAIKLLLKNFDNMQPIKEEPFTNMAYELIATNIRRYREEQELASMFGKRGGNPNLNPTLKGTLNSTHKQQDKTIQEINNNINKPTKKEIEDYCKLIAKKIDIDEFIAYYDATDWKDELGMPIIWKRKVLTFAKNYKPKEQEKENEYNPCL